MALAVNWLSRLRNFTRPTIVKEIIGRYVFGAQFTLYRNRFIKTVDETMPDYQFYDNLRHGKARGYSLGGLFATRIERIFASWVFGEGVEVTLKDKTIESAGADYTNGQLADFMASLLDAGQDTEEEIAPNRDDRQSSLLMTVFEDALGLGDQYIFVNPDGSLSIPSPDTVTVIRNPLDYRQIDSAVIETRLDDYNITDEYRLDGRTITVYQASRLISTQQLQNLIDRIPMVHIANGMSGNETNGHSIHEQLKPLYDRYDDTIYKQLDGAGLLGNPMLALVGMEDINAVQNANQPTTNDTYLDKDGNQTTRPQLKIDRNAILLIGKGGDAKYVAPPVGFTADTTQALQSLFSLLLYQTGIPDSIWGDEQTSARATSETQNKQFVKEVQGRQRDNGGWLVRLCKIWLAFKALTDPQIVPGALALKWKPLTEENKEILLKYIDFAKTNGLLSDETALRLTALVDDPAAEVKEAQAEADARQQALFPDGTSAGFQQQLGQDMGQSMSQDTQQLATSQQLPANSQNGGNQ